MRRHTAVAYLFYNKGNSISVEAGIESSTCEPIRIKAVGAESCKGGWMVGEKDRRIEMVD
jgi:hypothetical protein